MVGSEGLETKFAQAGAGAKLLLQRKKREFQVAVMACLDGFVFGWIFAE
jgi:hypothetical protein